MQQPFKNLNFAITEPESRRTPTQMRQRVVSEIPRKPVDKLAAIVISPAPWWGKPMPSAEPAENILEIKRERDDAKVLASRLQKTCEHQKRSIARHVEENAKLITELNLLTAEVMALKERVAKYLPKPC